MVARQLALVDVESKPAAAPMTLRNYQQKAVISVAMHWAAGKNRVLLVAPTGSGKTAMACALMNELVRRGRPVLFCVHRDVLVSQTVESLSRWGIVCGHIKAGYRENRERLVQVCSVQSLARRDWWGKQDFDWDAAKPTVILDECHTTGWTNVVRDLLTEHPDMRLLGLTATPWRLAKKEDMGDIFDAVALSPFPAQLIADGYLVPPAYYGTVKAPDLSNVRVRAGEYVEEDLAVVCDTPEMVEAAVDDALRLAPGRRLLAFTTNVAHAHHIAAGFNRRGVKAAAVSGETPLEERAALYAALRKGEIKALASCAVLSEGFDVPEVSAVLLARPTKSRSLFHQQIGRGFRLAPWDGKTDCVVIDQAGNVGRFGFVEDFAEFELRGGRPGLLPKKPPADDEAPETTKECPKCHAIVKRLVPKCACGYLWPLPKVSDALHAKPLVAKNWSKEDRCLAYRDLLRKAYVSGWKPEAAAMKYRDMVGEWPDRTWTTGAVMGLHPTEDEQLEYQNYLEGLAMEKDMDVDIADAWIEKWCKAELG